MDISQFNFIQFTEEELAEQTQWETIHHQQNELLLSLTEQLTKTNEGETDKLIAQMQETIKEMGTARTELMKIYRAAEKRYYESVPTEQAILDDARKVLAAATKEDYENTREQSYKNYKGISEYIKKDKERYKDVHNAYFNLIALSQAKPPELNYSGYFAYLIGCTRLQLNAFKHHNLHNAPLADLIREQAAAAYEPPEELPELPTEQQKLEIIRTSRTENFISLNSEPVNFLFNPEREENAISQFGVRQNGQLFFNDVDILTGRKGTQEKVNQISVYYDDAAFTYTRNGKPVLLNDYDRSILDGIVTLIENGTRAFTLPMLYAEMTQEEIHKIKVTETIEKKLKTGLNRLEGTKVKYKVNSEQRTFTDNSGKTIKIKQTAEREAVLSLGEKFFNINGQEVEAYYLKELPPLYVDAKENNRLITTPRNALLLEAGERNTTEVIALKTILKTEIARIKSPDKGGHKQSNHITYDKIYARISYVKEQKQEEQEEQEKQEKQEEQKRELDNKQKAKIRQSTIKILNRFVQTKQIAAFKEVKKGKEYHHIEIITNEQAKKAKKK